MNSAVRAFVNSMNTVPGLELFLYSNQWNPFFVFEGVVRRAGCSEVERCDVRLLSAVGNESYGISFLVCRASEEHSTAGIDISSEGDESANVRAGRVEDGRADCEGTKCVRERIFRGGMVAGLLNEMEALACVARRGQ